MAGFLTGSGFIGKPGFICGGANPIIPHIGELINFSYTGGIQTWVVPYSGWYRIAATGASGMQNQYCGSGYGGLTVGWIYLVKGDTYYIGVGGTVSNWSDGSAGYNGGGSGGSLPAADQVVPGGGGCTHIAKVSGRLMDIGYTSFVTNGNGILVAGGGGSGAFQNAVRTSNGGSGGGLTGGNADYGGTGGSQSAAGGNPPGGFGYGGGGGYQGSGGGGGFFGGGGSTNLGAGGGGSGWYDKLVNYDATNVKYMANGQQSGNGAVSITIWAA